MMKKLLLVLLGMLCLTGCGQTEVFETVGDELLLSAIAQPAEIRLTLPEETVLPVMETEDGMVYMCKDFDVYLQTLEGGDLLATIQRVSGYAAEDLTVVETAQGNIKRYEFVWSAMGELGEQICRCAILDDGSYHYAVTALVDADKAGEYQEIWNGMFETFTLT